MDIFRLTFQLGVFFAIYSFIWFFIDIGIKLMTSGMVKGILFKLTSAKSGGGQDQFDDFEEVE